MFAKVILGLLVPAYTVGLIIVIAILFWIVRYTIYTRKLNRVGGIHAPRPPGGPFTG